jgi:hypothetical protein
MEYKYSDKYNVRPFLTRKKVQELHNNSLCTQQEYDTQVDKGLLQVMKEDKLAFKALITKIQREMVREQHSEDRWRIPAYEQLGKYKGKAYNVAEGTPLSDALRWYWYDHLGVGREG